MVKDSMICDFLVGLAALIYFVTLLPFLVVVVTIAWLMDVGHGIRHGD